MLPTKAEGVETETPGKESRGQTIKPEFGKNGYDYAHGWNTTAQPEQNCRAEDYVVLASLALDDAKKQMTDFATEYGYSHATLTHADLREYETGTEPDFRKWFETKCKETGQNPNVSLLIISPCVKGLKRAQNKSDTHGKKADRIIDYQRAMYVVLKQSKRANDKKSVQTLKKLINDIEADSRTVARKNLFWKPHKDTGFRAHKTLRIATVPEGAQLEGLDIGGFQILTEVKIEHECQMGMDRATRTFLNTGREAQRAFKQFNYARQGDSGRIAKEADRLMSASNEVSEIGQDLYNKIFSDAGLNELLAPEIKAKLQKPQTEKEIIREIKNNHKTPKGVKKRLLSALSAAGVIKSAPLLEQISTYLQQNLQ